MNSGVQFVFTNVIDFWLTYFYLFLNVKLSLTKYITANLVKY